LIKHCQWLCGLFPLTLRWRNRAEFLLTSRHVNISLKFDNAVVDRCNCKKLQKALNKTKNLGQQWSSRAAYYGSPIFTLYPAEVFWTNTANEIVFKISIAESNEQNKKSLSTMVQPCCVLRVSDLYTVSSGVVLNQRGATFQWMSCYQFCYTRRDIYTGGPNRSL
jgi:hypothetical protein